MTLSGLFVNARLWCFTAVFVVVALLLGWTPCGATPKAGNAQERWKASFTVHYSTPTSASVAASLATVAARLEVLEQAEKALQNDALMRLLAQDSVNGAYRRMALVATAYPVRSTLQRTQGAITSVAVIRTSPHKTETLLREALRKTDSLDAWATVLARYTVLVSEGMRLLEQENREEKRLYASSIHPALSTNAPDTLLSEPVPTDLAAPTGLAPTTSLVTATNASPIPAPAEPVHAKATPAPSSAVPVDTPFSGTFDTPPTDAPSPLATAGTVCASTPKPATAPSRHMPPSSITPDQATPNQATAIQTALYNTLAKLQALADQLQALDEYCSALRYFDGTWPNPEAALKSMDKALALEPDNALFLLGRAEALIQLDRVFEGLETLNTAARLDDFPARGYYARGVAQLRLHMPSLAIHDLSKALALRPDKAAWWHARGAAKLLSGEHDTLCEDLYQACALGDCQGLANVRLRNLCQ